MKTDNIYKSQHTYIHTSKPETRGNIFNVTPHYSVGRPHTFINIILYVHMKGHFGVQCGAGED